MGAIRRLPNGKYQCDVIDHKGKRHRLSFTRKTDAAAYNAEVEKTKYALKLSKIGLRKPLTNLDEFILSTLKSKESLAPKTYAKYKGVFEVFSEFIKDKNIELPSLPILVRQK